MRALRCSITLLALAGLLPGQTTAAGPKPLLTLDQFFNSVSINSVQLSPDGKAVLIATERADWAANRFRSELWLYRDAPNGGLLVQLTQSGHDSNPQWSPDGRWIAFVSDRPAPAAPAAASQGAGAAKPETKDQVYVISEGGGEAFQLTAGKEGVHAYAWSADSRSIYYATRTPWSDRQEEQYKLLWHDVIQYREAERGDVINRVELAATPLAETGGFAHRILPVAATPERVHQMVAAPDGRTLAFATDSRSKRIDSMRPYGIDVVDLRYNSVRVALHKEGIPDDLNFAKDSKHVFFTVGQGSVEGPYEDVQPRIYWLDVSTGALARWAANFTGAIRQYTLSGSDLVAGGRMGTEVQTYTQPSPSQPFTEHAANLGTYERFSGSLHNRRLAFVYSSQTEPPEVYLADGVNGLKQARRITSFNRFLTEYELPQSKPYRWRAEDGTSVEGMLIYPPGKFGTRDLPLFTLIHGGPASADGNHFEADWYQWGALAATDGWLVFEPNYRGSTGYGDAFTLGIIHTIVSRPGKDILEGVDALVKDGIADPAHLTVGGYSYGGYMTNWLITQTTRFKAAVTGAGAIEHAANWGNDDMSFDDAYFLGGTPWEARKNYDAEAGLFQFEKVTTPTHVVGGAVDIRVYVGEDYLLERALHVRKIPSSLLIFPGEGHGLGKNPWHGKIKVREELKWLDQYGR
jgi:dipeptidyl aminopeptidase/acylaminoacyl peptidase